MALSIRWQRIFQRGIPISLLFVGFCLGGWWLTALGAAWFLWLGTGLMTGYLVAVGTGAIVLSNSWIVFLIAVTLISARKPVFWPVYVPYQLWAITMMLLWVIGGGLVILLGIQAQALKDSPSPTRQLRQWSLVLLLWLGLGVGYLTYHLGSAPQ